jgi:hypothetical protein
VFSFLPVLRRGLINLEGYIAFSLFPHLSAIPLAGFIFVTVGSGNAHAEVWRCSVAGLATDFARVTL